MVAQLVASEVVLSSIEMVIENELFGSETVKIAFRCLSGILSAERNKI